MIKIKIPDGADANHLKDKIKTIFSLAEEDITIDGSFLHIDLEEVKKRIVKEIANYHNKIVIKITVDYEPNKLTADIKTALSLAGDANIFTKGDILFVDAEDSTANMTAVNTIISTHDYQAALDDVADKEGNFDNAPKWVQAVIEGVADQASLNLTNLKAKIKEKYLEL